MAICGDAPPTPSAQTETKTKKIVHIINDHGLHGAGVNLREVSPYVELEPIHTLH